MFRPILGATMKPHAIANPPNPWASTEVEYLPDPQTGVPLAKLEVFEDQTKTIVSRNDSPDVGFEFSVNPYRGCMHACAYCYARPGHEYLSLRAGTDFETKIMVKPKAPQLLREAFEKPSWKGEVVVFSGVTDCYQPLEASYRLTRGCLEVCAEYRQPVGIITKAPLVERDIDILQDLAKNARVRVNLSVPFWNAEHARAIEPGVATPKRRLRAIEALAKAGIPVGLMIAPIIPGLSDEGISMTLKAAREAGASSAGYVLLRLPGPVKEVFEERVREAMPLRAEKILHRIRETRGGALYDARFGVRGVGEGKYAEMIAATFEAAKKKLGYPDTHQYEVGASTFRRPSRKGPQLSLFGDM